MICKDIESQVCRAVELQKYEDIGTGTGAETEREMETDQDTEI